MPRDTGAILALKLVRPAGDIVADFLRLVVAAGAIAVAVAHPTLVDTSQTVCTLEVIGLTPWPGRVRAARRGRPAVGLVLAIITVDVAVAYPPENQTKALHTFFKPAIKYFIEKKII